MLKGCNVTKLMQESADKRNDVVLETKVFVPRHFDDKNVKSWCWC